MPNKHLEHPEDAIFDGRRSAVGAIRQMLAAKWNISVKYDGAPAIVFGTNPDNGRFFVGTKSVFNKKKVLINYTQEDIDKNHKGNVADILRLCLRYLPRIKGIVQADWIGVGGGRVYKPNTLEYRFPDYIDQDIIVAPHTCYDRVSPDAKAKLGVKLQSTDECYFINTNDAYVTRWNSAAALKAFAQIPFAKIPKSKKSCDYLRKYINGYVRSGYIPCASVLYNSMPDKYKEEVNVTTFKVWQTIFQLKMRFLESISVGGNIQCFINGQSTGHEGFVILSDNPYKIVDRLTFSNANFNLDKNWTNEKV
jgi:hypothetical protein